MKASIKNAVNAQRLLPGARDLPFQDIFVPTISQRRALGARLQVYDNVFRYGQAGADGALAGNLYQMPVPVSTHVNMVPVGTYPIGSSIISVTLGADPVTENQYAEGYLYIGTGTGFGQKLRIKSHPAAAGSATVAITCWDALGMALNATSRISLVANKYKGLIIHPSPPTAKLVGVPLVTFTANQYGWFCVKGPCPVLTDGAIVIGDGVIPSDTVDGAVEAEDGAALVQRVGAVMRPNGNGLYSLIDLNLE